MNSNARDRRKFVSIAVIATCALVLGVGLSSCTASQAEPASKASENPTPVPATVEWKSKEVLVSDVELIGDVAIAYRHQGPQLEIIARNLKTANSSGKMRRWALPMPWVWIRTLNSYSTVAGIMRLTREPKPELMDG